MRTSIDFSGLSDALTQWWAQAGAERTFYFSVRNTGRATEHVPLTVTPGPNLRVTSVQCLRGDASCLDTSAGANVWAIAAIGKGEQVRVVVRAIEQNPQSYRAQLRLAAELPGDPEPWENSALHDRAVYLADRSVALDAPATAVAGGEVQVRLTVGNQGPDAFYEPRQLTLPAGVVVEAIGCAMADGGSCTTATLDASDVGVRANQAALLSYRIRVPADYRGPLTIGKTLSRDGDIHPADNSASVTILIDPPGTP